MASPGKAQKRKSSTDRPISPPPLRRKVQSTTTQTAVASFFTPTSQRPPEKIYWQERAPNDDTPSTLLIGKFEPSNSLVTDASSHNLKRNKVAAFDFDSTLIQTSSGKKHSSNGQDWKWWHSSVPGTLRKMYLEDGLFSCRCDQQPGWHFSQNGPQVPKARLAEFKTKVSAVFNHLDIPVSIYAATEKDIYRKPRTGMWKELLEDYDIHLPGDLDLQESIFVGDAAGRHASTGEPKDFSCSDRNFAENVGIKFYTPEEYFLQEPPRPFTRTFEPGDYNSGNTTVSAKYEKDNPTDVVIFCGSPGAGKSTFYWKQLEPLGYARVNQDILKTRDKCFRVAGQYLDEGKSVVVDNTNADRDVRSKWIALAAKYSVPIRCVHFLAGVQVCEHNDAVRAFNETMNPEKRKILPKLAFTSFASRYQRPELTEGFQDITEVPFNFEGNEAQREIWTQHWT